VSLPPVTATPEARGKPKATYVGRPVLRVEDRDLLMGTARFIDDIDRPGQLYVSFVRSQVSHGKLRTVDLAPALARSSVVTAISADDLPEGLRIPLRLAPNPAAMLARQPALARGMVRYVGEPIAAIVATSRYAAEDAADQVRVEIEAVASILDCEISAAPAADAIHEAVPDNVVARRRVTIGNIDKVFDQAGVVVRERLAIHRHTAMPLETRGLLAELDAEGQLQVWGAAKVKHFNRLALAELLDLPAERVRLRELAVGGGFGVRGELYPEDLVIPWLALRLGRPVKWVEDRREHFLATNHSREQVADVEVAADSTGRLLAIRLRAFVDLGAYVRTNALVLPLNTATHIAGPYRWEAVDAEALGVLTNKTPVATYRGPGMFEPAYYRERALDILASRMALDPVELRRRNLIPHELLPLTVDAGADVDPIVYGAGDYPLVWDRLCQAGGYADLKEECDERRGRGHMVGIGTSAFIEAGARGPYEWARIVPGEDGSFDVHLGLSSVGQGLATALSQIAADALQIELDQVRVCHASTDDVADSAGSFASRSTVFGGGAVVGAARDLVEKAVIAVAVELDVDASSIVVADGAASAGERQIRLSSLGVEGFHRYERQGRTYSMGGALVVASVDAETGAVRVERCVVAWDVGRAINPVVVEGQLVGAAAQGIGGALFEELPYDDGGQPLATSFLDYVMVSAVELPRVETVILELAATTEDPSLIFGAKGAGEAGIIGLGAAVANAVANAVPRGDELRRLPLDAATVARLLP
jgi:CO/xanthine dehydrogenase Mo-binding subunit